MANEIFNGDGERGRSGQPNDAPMHDRRAEPGERGRRSAGGGGGSRLMLGVVVLVIVAAAVAAFAWFGGSSFLDGANGGGAAAVVNGEEIPRAEYEQLLDRQLRTYEMQLQQAAAQQPDVDVEAELDRAESTLRQQAITTLINQELVTQRAQELGITVSDQAVEQGYQEQIQAVGGQEAFQARLDELGLTADEIRENVRTQLLLEEFVDQQAPTPIEVTQQEIRAFYDQQVAQLEAQLGTSSPDQEIPPLEQVSAQLEQQLLMQERQAVLTDLLEQLQQNAEIEVLLQGVTYAPASNPLPPASDSNTEASTGGNNTATSSDNSASVEESTDGAAADAQEDVSTE